MRSLLARIFLSFWLIIGITIGLAALAGYYYAERMRAAAENFEIRDVMFAAGRALEEHGRDGLVDWLESRPRGDAMLLYVLDAEGRELLGRRVPRRVRHFLHRGQAHFRDRAGHPDLPENLRPARPFTQLVAPDGDLYTLVAIPAHRRNWLDERRFPLLLVLAIIVSGGISYLLARTLSRPVESLRGATVALADGKLDTRVGTDVRRRRDELGLLARDFDTMAEKLESAARRQAELSRNVSHELRSPLARLRVALELARRRAGDLPEFARIDAETERLDRLIGQILRYTRLDAESSELPAEADLADLLREVVENVNYECRSDGVAGVSVEFTANASPRLAVHADALQSAVENVLRNAVRHSPANATVDLSLDAGDGQATIEIADRGPGVDAAELGELFEPFFRTRTARTNADWPGSGLGLAIAARAVRLHDGRIRAENVPGGGLRVVIELPLA